MEESGTQQNESKLIALGIFNTIYGNRELSYEETDTTKERELKDEINNAIARIYECVEYNPELILDGVNTRRTDGVEEFVQATKQLSLKEAELHEIGGGGTSSSFASALEEAKANPNVQVGLNDLLHKIKKGRTSTRYSFTVDPGKQGPHTVARCMGIELRQRRIRTLFNDATLNVANVKALYEIHLDDEWKFIDNADYQYAYSNCLAIYNGEKTNPFTVIAYGQMLVDLHPFATTSTLATGKDIAGKGEGRALAKWLATGSIEEGQKLIDKQSIAKNKDKVQKKQYENYVGAIMAHYEKLRNLL